jgi:hypothetical protein
VAPYQPRRVLQHVGQPSPAVFGPSGLFNPLVPLLSAGVLVVQGGVLSLVAVVMGAMALVALLKRGGRDIRVLTVVLALVLAMVLGAVVGISGSANDPSPPPFPDLVEPPTGATAPSAEAVDLTPPVTTRTLDDFSVPELRSVPVSSAPDRLPDVYDPGATPEDSEHAWQATDVDVRPRLENEDEAARALATVFAENRMPRDRPDTAVLWLLVSRKGQVTASQVVFSTTSRVAGVAVQTLPYLRYAPGEAGGRAVPTWISQRVVVVP